MVSFDVPIPARFSKLCPGGCGGVVNRASLRKVLYASEKKAALVLSPSKTKHDDGCGQRAGKIGLCGIVRFDMTKKIETTLNLLLLTQDHRRRKEPKDRL